MCRDRARGLGWRHIIYGLAGFESGCLNQGIGYALMDGEHQKARHTSRSGADNF